MTILLLGCSQSSEPPVTPDAGAVDPTHPAHPALLAVFPANGATGVVMRPSVGAMFSAKIATLGSFVVTAPDGTEVPGWTDQNPGALTPFQAAETVTWLSKTVLQPNVMYTATISNLHDLDGASVPGVSWSFTTSSALTWLDPPDHFLSCAGHLGIEFNTAVTGLDTSTWELSNANGPIAGTIEPGSAPNRYFYDGVPGGEITMTLHDVTVPGVGTLPSYTTTFIGDSDLCL